MLLAGSGYLAQWITGLIFSPVIVVLASVLIPAVRARLLLPVRRRAVATWVAAGLIAGVVVLALWQLWTAPFLQSTMFWRPILPSELSREILPAVTASLLLAGLNAAYEEILWRHSVPAAVCTAWDQSRLASLSAGAGFALAHLNGIPSGITGVALTYVFAIVCSEVVRRSRSLHPAIAVHFLADVSVIFPLSGYGM
jgi:hypothetical protein